MKAALLIILFGALGCTAGMIAMAMADLQEEKKKDRKGDDK